MAPNMIQDTDLVFRDPYLDHNNSQSLRIHVFLNSISVYIDIDMLHLFYLQYFYNPRWQHMWQSKPPIKCLTQVYCSILTTK